MHTAAAPRRRADSEANHGKRHIQVRSDSRQTQPSDYLLRRTHRRVRAGFFRFSKEERGRRDGGEVQVARRQSVFFPMVPAYARAAARPAPAADAMVGSSHIADSL